MGDVLTRARPVPRAASALAVAVVLGLAACSAPSAPSTGSSPIGGGSGAGGRPAATSAAAPTPSPTPSPTSASAALAECVTGTWRVRTISPTRGGAVEHVEFSGRGAFDLAFRGSDGWRLVGRPDSALTATFEVVGVPVMGVGRVDGTAAGRYTLVDDTGVFRVERTSGQVDVRWPTGEQTYGMAELTGALVPEGTATLRCSGDRLTLESKNVTLSLTPR